MRLLFLSMVVFCLNWSVYAASVVSSSDTNNLVEENSTTVSNFSEVVPAPLYVTTVFSNNGILAPIHGNEFALNLTAERLSFKRDYEGGKEERTDRGILQAISIAHAFNKHFFLSTSVSLMNYHSESEWTNSYSSNNDLTISKSKGVADPYLTLGGRIYSKSMTTILSLSHKFSNGMNETRYNDNNISESDAKSGGSSIVPAITVHTNSLDTVFGGAISYTMQGTRTLKNIYSDQVTTYNYTGGNVQKAAIFAEIPVKKIKLGGIIDYVKFESSKYKEEKSSITSTSRARSYATATALVKFDVTEKFELTPNVSYGQFGEGFADTTSKEILSVGVIGVASF